MFYWVKALPCFARMASVSLFSTSVFAGNPVPPSPSSGPATAPPGMYIDPPGGLPAAPASSAPKVAVAGSTSGAAAKGPTESLVEISQAGREIAVGIVLDQDGRILTGLRTKGRDALSSSEVVLKYADGAKSRGKIAYEDAVTGLALVTPLDDVRRKGIRASEASSFRALSHLSMAMEGTQMMLAAFVPEETSLVNQIAAPTNDKIVLKRGSAFVDLSGAVAGIATPLCGAIKGQPASCKNLGMVSVSAIRAFLGKTPAEAAVPAAWLGIAVEPEAAGLRVSAVAPKSPAAAAGLRGASAKKPGDLILAVDGKPVATPDELSKAIAAHVPGEKLSVALAPEAPKTEARMVAVVLRPAQ